ncbi:MAG: hypothetical protein KGM96_09390 [Acidobacteriota bacterium]|nr:hypothetical protein [Acidobacteriota bacterium]
MFSPSNAPAGTGPVVLFEFDCLHPTNFTLRFSPDLRWMWPERTEGVPGAEWVPRTGSAGGFYVLHTDYPDLAGAVTIPGAEPGILAPYQERPQVHPVELKLHIDPARDHGRLFPLLMAVGTTTATATDPALGATLAQLNQSIAASYAAHAESYKKLLASSTSITTPDKTLNQAFQWAVVSIEQLRAKTSAANAEDSRSKTTGSKGTGFSPYMNLPKNTGALAPEGNSHQPIGETALVAGYYESGDSARPGFGWFFGRDALYTLYAVNGYGDFALSKAELEFLIHRQRDDGKIMHEYSQTAANIDWRAFPYMYAAADATPLFLLAVEDYVRSSGDTAFLTTHRDAIEKAWAFETDPAHDTDHDGIYDNSQGTGWVESWPGGMPHQEVYLALLDQQASAAMAHIEDQLHDSAKASAAQARADKLAQTIEAEYYDPQKGCYAFSHNFNNATDNTTTVYPALAWWSGKPILAHADACLAQFASATLSTDWGLRDVANNEKDYDGMSYHQGSVWPLFTGWAALAEYRGNQPLAGYQLLMENANLTRAQDLGAVTELLSGDFFVPFGRSTSHQLWSSAMVITPTLRGLFGLTIDAQSKTITVNPHLPATWDHTEIRNLRIGSNTANLTFARNGGALTASLEAPAGIRLISAAPGAKQLAAGKVSIPLPAVEVGDITQAPLPGDRTNLMRVLKQEYGQRKLTLTLEGPAGTDARLPLVETAPNLRLAADGAELHAPASAKPASSAVEAPSLLVHFPPGEGWKTVTVTLTW